MGTIESDDEAAGKQAEKEEGFELQKDGFFQDLSADIDMATGKKSQAASSSGANMWNFRDDTLHMKTKDQYIKLLTPLRENIEAVYTRHNLNKADYNIFTKGSEGTEEKKEDDEKLEEASVVATEKKGPTKTFEELSLCKALIKACGKCEYYTPSRIQNQAIPIILSGSDVIGSAVTGSGKTAAYLLPILEKLLHKASKYRYQMTRVLIIVPTRELAVQCRAMLHKLKEFTEITDALAIGGVNLAKQESELRAHPDVVIATPGRLLDILRNSRSINLQNVKTLVLDEADKLLELGFMDAIKDILSQCNEERQTLLFSATLTSQLSQLANIALKKPVTLSADPSEQTCKKCAQYIVRLGKAENDESTEKYREAALILLCGRDLKKRTLIFANTKKKCHELCMLLMWFGLNAAEVHANLTQSQRLEIVDAFQRGHIDFLVASDLFARGMDIVKVKAVVNYEMPIENKRYIHRIGRTARGGSGGVAISICSETERKELKRIVKKNKDELQKHTMKQKDVEEIVAKIDSIHDYLIEIDKQERLEKQYFMATIEMTKAENIIKHKDEIINRPKRYLHFA
ncbi:MAG: DEAD/DEAH box helicase [Candidatus Pacebacteria bacterium]|nr:DEAD/DEAH box helicase [Candidatus Paceibacterota bacterium]